MKPEEIEDLFIRSFDEPLNEAEKEQLVSAMRDNPPVARELAAYKDIRETVLRKIPATFGPYFAQKIVTRIQNMHIQIDRQIVFFFKKFQLAAAGVMVALLAVNVIFADQLNISSVLNIQDSVATASQPATNPDSVTDDVDVVSFDILDNLMNNTK